MRSLSTHIQAFAFYHIISLSMGGAVSRTFCPFLFYKFKNFCMTYLTLAEIKKHCNIDTAFTDDDSYLTALASAAEDVVAKYIDYPLVQLQDAQGKLPEALKFAMLLWIGTIYAVRESTSAVNMTTVPHSLELLCDLYRSYTINKDE